MSSLSASAYSTSSAATSHMNRLWQKCPSRETVKSAAENAACQVGSKTKAGAIRTKQFAKDHPVITAAVAGGTVAIVAAPALLAAAGFGAGGVTAGSAATIVQSTVYGGATTGLFSSLTSAGAVGIGATGTAVAGGVGATTGAVTAHAITKNQSKM